MKRKSPTEIKAEMLLAKARQYNTMTPEQQLEVGRKELNDSKIALGYHIGFGLALVELMIYWEELDENIKDFIARHYELMEVYQSTDKKDKEQLLEWFKELEERTGYRIVEEDTDNNH